MWPFRRAKPDPTILDYVERLGAAQAELEQKVKRLELEWDDMFDRFRRLYAKISKRAAEAEGDANRDREGTEGRPLDDRPAFGRPGPVTIVGSRMPLGRYG